jgi:hypothetical protein
MGVRVGLPAPERIGPVAQWLEPTAHNGLVGGSNPPGPTNFNAFRVPTLLIVRECSLSVHEYHWSIVGQPGGHTSFGTRGSQVQILPLRPIIL